MIDTHSHLFVEEFSEDNEMLLRNQLELLKIEIKKTREERDELKKQIQHNNNNNNESRS